VAVHSNYILFFVFAVFICVCPLFAEGWVVLLRWSGLRRPHQTSVWWMLHCPAMQHWIRQTQLISQARIKRRKTCKTLLTDVNFHPCNYRATHMHSADYAMARYLFVCLSVHPSLTHCYSVEMAKHIISVNSPLGSQTILVCPYQMVCRVTTCLENQGIWQLPGKCQGFY